LGTVTALFALAMALAILPSAGAAQKATLDAAAADRAVRALVDSGFSGVVLLAAGDSVLLRRAYGARLSPDDAFWIASITKSFTAAAVLRLQEQRRLKVADSIYRFLPDVPPDKRAITIQQLLTHTAGLGGEYSGGGIADRREAVRAILRPALIYPPGQGYRYGDDDYELLAAVIEIVTGQSWEDYVREQVVRPAGLRHVGFACQPCGDLRASCDWGHKGANGMFGTADDLLHWSRSLRADEALGAAGRGALEVPQVLVRREPPFDVSYGYGVRVYTLHDTTVEVMHSGSGDDGHTSIVRVLRNGITVVVLSNAGMHAGTTWSSYVARKLATRS